MPLPALIAAAPYIIGAAGSLISGALQSRHNKQLAKFQASANERYLSQQQAYNSPASQMRRYQDAGLNPNLIYSQGNPGTQSQPLSYPDIKPVDYAQLMSMLPVANQTRLVDAQVEATNARTRHEGAKQHLTELQQLVLSKNPMLDEAALAAMISSIVSGAEIKGLDVGIRRNQMWISNATAGHQAEKVHKELLMLEQRFNLGQLDAKVKNQVIKSKEFQNALLEVQTRFQSDGDMGPQQYYQLALMLLQTLMK